MVPDEYNMGTLIFASFDSIQAADSSVRCHLPHALPAYSFRMAREMLTGPS